MIIDEQIFHFSVDSDHRDAFGGAADLRYTDKFKINLSGVYNGEKIESEKLKSAPVHFPLIKSDMLSVEMPMDQLTVMSIEMISVIDQFWQEKLYRIPAVIEDNADKDYFVVQLPMLDIFDWKNSEYNALFVDENLDGTRSITTVDKYAFTVETADMPPIFTLTAQKSQMFIKTEVRRALHEHGIRGVSFKKASRFSGANQYVTDLPV